MGSDVEVVAGRARLEITRPGGVELAPLEELRPLAGEALFTPIVESFGLSPGLEDIVRLLGVDLLIPEIIDNSTFSYRIVVFLSGGNSATRLSGVRLVYTPIRVFHDGFENGNTAVWSDAVP